MFKRATSKVCPLFYVTKCHLKEPSIIIFLKNQQIKNKINIIEQVAQVSNQVNCFTSEIRTGKILLKKEWWGISGCPSQQSTWEGYLETIQSWDQPLAAASVLTAFLLSVVTSGCDTSCSEGLLGAIRGSLSWGPTCKSPLQSRRCDLAQGSRTRCWARTLLPQKAKTWTCLYPLQPHQPVRRHSPTFCQSEHTAVSMNEGFGLHPE